MLDEQQFRKLADEALITLQRALERAGDAHGFEVDRNEGALTVEFEEPPARFVVSPNTPVRQIWISALAKSFKLDWNGDRNAFVLNEDGRTLHQLMADVIGKQLGQTVSI